MKNASKPLFGLIALGAALAMPVAFAQDASTEAPPQDQEPAQSTAPAATQQPLTWADLDVDGNGTLSRTEASNVQSLAQAFDDADTDKDGELTPDEYKAFAAKANTTQPDGAGGSD